MNEKEAENKAKYIPKVNFSPKEEYGVEIPPCSNNSTYRSDYLGIYTKRPDPIRQEPDFHDILAGPFLDPLLPDSRLAKEQDSTQWESSDSLYKKFTEKYPCMKKKALPKEIDQSKITAEYDNMGKTVYQVEFSTGKEPLSPTESVPKVQKGLTKLPNDWVIPRSVYGTSYRNLTDMKNRNLISFEMKSKAFYPPPTELGFTKEEQQVLQTTTGETEYQEFHSNCGRDIMEHAYYGEIKPLPREFRPKEIKEEPK